MNKQGFKLKTTRLRHRKFYKKLDMIPFCYKTLNKQIMKQAYPN